jgi:diguanylate cyclase (GGDEF)-like protein/PAS domain S-box-containing protein
MTAEVLLALGAGAALGTFLTAAALWLHDRRTRRALELAGRRIRHSEARLRALLRDAHDIIAVIDTDGRLTYANPAAERLFGRRVAPLLGASPFELVHPDERDRVVQTFREARDRPGETEPVEVRAQHVDGSWRTLEVQGTNLLDDPAVRGLVFTARDVTERQRTDAELREAQARFRSAFNHAPIGMALVALDGRFLAVNRELAQMLGRAADELCGASVLSVTHPDDIEESAAAMRHAIAGDAEQVRFEKRYLHADGRPVWASLSATLMRDPDGTPLYFVSHVADITETKQSGERLAHQAIHDPLTGLPNRALFVERLRAALAEDDAARTAVIFLDLDDFKLVNDSLGHQAGDRLLVAVADRLRAAIRPNDLVARFGGDEFTVLCRDVPDAEHAKGVAARLSRAIAKPVTLTDGEVFVTASLGISLASGELDTPDTLLRDADAAMHRAKEEGRARTEVYESAAHDRAVRDLRTGNELHRALEREELRVHYQPIVRLDNGRVTGFEALVRWEHPERGLVRPDEFIGLAEQTGLVVPIGTWVLEQAARQVVTWQTHGSQLTMSVNLSPRQLAEPSLHDAVEEVLRATGVPPDSMWFEITEGTLMRDAEAAVVALGKLRALGVHLSVDDFGTGYSSMTYLKRFPVEALKVDRSFVDGLGREPEATAICTAVISLAHALGLRAVAEGIETSEQLAELRTLGCELGQGYLFGRPEPPERLGHRPDARPWGAFSSN